MNRATLIAFCVITLLLGSAATARADETTALPFSHASGGWIAVDPAGGHVFVSGGTGTSSIAVLDYRGTLVKTISGEGGASGMAVDTATHTLYVALHDASAIGEIDTRTLTKIKRFSTSPYTSPTSLVLAGGKLWFSCLDLFHGCVASASVEGKDITKASLIGVDYTTDLAAGGPDQSLLALGSSYGEPPVVSVYDVSGAAPSLVSDVGNPDGGSAQVRDMTFDPGGANLLLACGFPYFVESLTTTTLLSSAEYPTGAYPISVAASSNGFVAGGINTNLGPDVFIYPVDDTTPVRTFLIGRDDLAGVEHGLAFSPDTSRLFAVAQGSAAGQLVFDVLDEPTLALTSTSTSLSGPNGTLSYGSQATLTAHVSGTASGKVDLYATPAGGSQTLVGSSTIASGVVSFTVTPTRNTAYFAQLEQSGTYATSASVDLSTGVAPILSVSARPHGTGRLHGVKVSRTLLTADVTPARSDERLRFVAQQHAQGAWHTIATGRFPISTGQTLHANLLTSRAGLCRVRVAYPSNLLYAGSVSAWTTFHVPKVR